MNDEALARLMVTEMANVKKEERLAFLEIKRREVECREREVRNQEYRQCQDDIRFYLQPYYHLIGDVRMAMEELRAEIKAKYEGRIGLLYENNVFKDGGDQRRASELFTSMTKSIIIVLVQGLHKPSSASENGIHESPARAEGKVLPHKHFYP
ncbi:hypothetical protein Tco_0298393 [Tanacetum coccineum]